jgi:hypothetical protein
MLDSLTELSDMTFSWADEKARNEAAATGKKVNGFDTWGEYKDKMIGACKFIRDLPYHVIITALAKATDDENGGTKYTPLLQGNGVQAQVPGIFDNVLCGSIKTVRVGDKDEVRRQIITGQYAGWQGKVRDEKGTVLMVEDTGDVTTLLDKITGTPAK